NKGFASTINWVIEDGARVQAGDLILVLDDSGLQDQLRAQLIQLDQATANKVKAEQDYEIASNESKNKIQTAETAVEVAVLELEKYIGLKSDDSLNPVGALVGGMGTLAETGSYRQDLDDLTGKVRLAESDLEAYRERSAWAERMVKQKYMSASQAQAERSKMESALENLRSLQAKRTQLMTYDRRQKLTSLRSALDTAKRTYQLEKDLAISKEEQARTEKGTKLSIYLQEKEKLKDLEDQIKECKVYAPQEGMIVYFKQESQRFGSSPQGLIEQGAQVKEGQKILRIPNLRRMQVLTKVHEAMVNRIRGDKMEPTGIMDAFRGAMMLNTDAFGALVSQKAEIVDGVKAHLRKTYPRQFKEYEITERGQPATVRVDANPTVPLAAHVKLVAAVASQADSWVSDVKLYPTIVSIEGVVEKLKPDMSAEVTINVDGVKDVLTVPLQAVVGGAEQGVTRPVYVKTGEGKFERRDVELGLFNEKMIEVTKGLVEGDEVVTNPKVLLDENDKTKTRDGAEEKLGGKGEKNGEKAAGGPDYKGGLGEKGGFGEKGAGGGFDPTKKGGGGKRGGGGGGGPPGGGPKG
ncbi:MAG TPA: hypothetical protein VMZ71_11165, partial [Gemmataceae bacterium]|nr:hypothetical protein [Gemmataceae bacterium]